MQLPSRPLGPQRKRFGFLILLIGLSTFFSPIVTLNPPLLNRADWSPFHMASAVFARELPVPNGHFDEAVIEIGLLYVLMILALVAIFVPKTTKPLAVISSIGFAVSSVAKFWHHGFMYTFGWDYWDPGRMKMSLTWWLLPWVMPALLAVSFARNLDVE